MSHFSLRECADESIVQDVLKGELRRSSRKLGSPGPRTRSSLLMSPIGESTAKGARFALPSLKMSFVLCSGLTDNAYKLFQTGHLKNPRE